MENTKDKKCLIVGASHAGVNLAFLLRRQGWAGEIALFDRDPELPYHRPPLSKGFLSGDTSVEESSLKNKESYEQANIKLHLGVTVESISPTKQALRLISGETHVYDRLVLATGASAFLPPIPGLKDNDKIFTLRTAADARHIRQAYQGADGKRVVVIGGGYIGLEAAASLRKLGGEVTVLEREDRVLARVTSPEMSAFFTELHTGRGVTIATGHQVTAITTEKNHVMVTCDKGIHYPADLVIVGVGVTVNSSLAVAANLQTANGISVNERMQTSDQKIYAIGDCTNFYHPVYGRELRLESVQNAIDQAKVTAANLCGTAAAYDAIPWFWSDQYDVKLQMCGLSTGYNRLVMRREADADEHQRSYWYFADDRLLAVDAVNSARAYMLGMKLLKEGKSPDPEKLADPGVALHPKHLMA